MVLSGRDVSVDTSREEKQLAVDQIWSGDGGALRKSSISQIKTVERSRNCIQPLVSENHSQNFTCDEYHSKVSIIWLVLKRCILYKVSGDNFSSCMR